MYYIEYIASFAQFISRIAKITERFFIFMYYFAIHSLKILPIVLRVLRAYRALVSCNSFFFSILRLQLKALHLIKRSRISLREDDPEFSTSTAQKSLIGGICTNDFRSNKNGIGSSYGAEDRQSINIYGRPTF